MNDMNNEFSLTFFIQVIFHAFTSRELLMIELKELSCCKQMCEFYPLAMTSLSLKPELKH